MKKVKYYICHIKEEMHCAEEYAEKYICYKQSHPQWSKMYSEMATAELNHANYLQIIGNEAISALSWVPEKCREHWEKCIAHKAEKEALVRLMLSK